MEQNFSKMQMQDINNIEKLDVMALEGVVKEYPWFAYARHLLLVKLARMSSEIFETQLATSAIYLASRSALYRRINECPTDEDFEAFAKTVETESVIEAKDNEEYARGSGEPAIDSEEPVEIEQITDIREFAPSSQAAHTEQHAKSKVIVVGGDYFQKSDFEELEEEEDEEKKLADSPFYRPDGQRSPKGTMYRTSDGKVNYEDLAFFTETLGHIYAGQGYNEKAIDVFSKLILLYPQKSAYFAALINQIKKEEQASSNK